MNFIKVFLNFLNMDNWNNVHAEKKIETDSTIPIESSPSEMQNEYAIAEETVDGSSNFEQPLKEESSPVINLTEERLISEQTVEPDSSSLTDINNGASIAELAVECDSPSRDLYNEEPTFSYRSSKMIIPGVHMYFIDIAREIISSGKISKIPLMREYCITESVLNDIIQELQMSGLLTRDNQITMTMCEAEHFFDIYKPGLFKCEHTAFDKDIFMCIGEIIFEDGIDKTYDCLSPDEVLDYLNIMERLKVIDFDTRKNEYNLLITKEEFYDLSKYIPTPFTSADYIRTDIYCNETDYDSLSGIEFEKYCSYLLSQNGYNNIRFTPASGDHGIDLLAQRDEITYAIQCKCDSSNIGNSAIQQAHTGKALYHCDVAVVMTNRFFTKQAHEEAATLGVKLWDRTKIESLNIK